MTKTKKEAHKSNNCQLKSQSLNFTVKVYSPFSATRVPSQSSMVENTSVFSENLTCSDYEEFEKCRDRFGQISSSKNDSTCFDVKLEVFKRENRAFRLVQNISAAENFGREENLYKC